LKVISIQLKRLSGDSAFYSDRIATMLGQTDANKNFEVRVNHVNKILEIRFSHSNKRGWANQSNWSVANENAVKAAMQLRGDFDKIIKEEVLPN